MLIVSHALKHLHTEATPSVKAVMPESVQPVKAETPVVQEERTPKEPTPINKSLERVKEYLVDHPKASAREVGRALGMSPPTAAKWVNRVRSA